MADTLPDFVVPADDWVSVESQTSLAAGTALIIQNKGWEGILLAINSVKPDADSIDGPQIYGAPNPLSTITVDAGENSVWLKSTTERQTLVNVQVGTASSGGGGTPVAVQSNWDETDAGEGSFIQNKPTALSEFTNDLDLVDSVTAGTGPVSVDNTDPNNPIISSTAIEAITVADEGSNVATDITRIDYVGDLVTATNASGGTATVTIDSAALSGTFADPISVSNQGSSLTTDLESINVVGGGITATSSGGDVTLTVPPIPVNLSQLGNDIPLVESVTVGSGLLTVDNTDGKNPILNTTAIAGIGVEKDGTQVVGTATTVNVTGDAVTVTDAGGGEVTVNIDTNNFISTFSAPITVQEEGVNVATAVDMINFTGAGITATSSGNDIQVTVPEIPTALSDLTNDVAVTGVVGVAPGITIDNTDPRQPRISTTAITGIRVEEEGVSTVTSATAINVVGDNVTVTDAGSGEATITFTTPAQQGNDIAISEEGSELTSAVESINFVGGGTATAVGADVTVTLPTIPTDVSELTNTSLVESVSSGTGIQVNNTDAINPVIGLDTRVVTAAQSATQTLDLDGGRTFVVEASAATTLAFSNIPPGSSTWKVVVNVSGGAAVTLPPAEYPGGTAPTLADGRNRLVYTTEDGGTTLAAVHIGGGVFS